MTLFIRNSFRLLLVSLVLLASSCAHQATTTSAQNSAAPDTIFINGKVLTVDQDFSEAQAVAVTANKISAVGSSESIAALANDDTYELYQ